MSSSSTETAGDAGTRVRDALARVAPRFVPGARGVVRAERLSGGASQETWSFAVAGGDGESRWILRRRPPGAGTTDPRFACGLDVEAKLIALAARAGVPVPRVAYELRDDDALGSGFVTAHVDGETIARRILRDDAFRAARAVLAAQCGESLARIHSIGAPPVPGLRVAPARDELAAWRERYESFGTPKPVYALAIAWLAANVPATTGPPCLVHGDFRHGNLVVGADGLRAVLDWELAHVGDPMEDLGWICVNSWRFGNSAAPVGGFGTREQLFEAYEAAGGRPVDRGAVKFWEVLGTMKWGLICQGMAMGFKAGDRRTLERAAVGRRASEAELDLLQLLAPRLAR